MWLLYFVNAFQGSVLGNLIPYVTSEWESHSLLSVIYLVSDAITAACYIPLGKIMDLWGRAEGFLFMTVCATAGLIMMAAGKNLATFSAAYVRLSYVANSRVPTDLWPDRCFTPWVSAV